MTDAAAGDPDALILVDAADRVVGRLSKSRCHELPLRVPAGIRRPANRMH